MMYDTKPPPADCGPQLSALTKSLQERFGALNQRFIELAKLCESLQKESRSEATSRSSLAQDVKAIDQLMKNLVEQLTTCSATLEKLVKRSNDGDRRLAEYEARLRSIESALPSIERLNALLAE